MAGIVVSWWVHYKQSIIDSKFTLILYAILFATSCQTPLLNSPHLVLSRWIQRRLICHHFIDLFHNFPCQLLKHIQAFHILDNLFRLRSSSDHRRDILVLQTPCQGKLSLSDFQPICDGLEEMSIYILALGVTPTFSFATFATLLLQSSFP